MSKFKNYKKKNVFFFGLTLEVIYNSKRFVTRLIRVSKLLTVTALSLNYLVNLGIILSSFAFTMINGDTKINKKKKEYKDLTRKQLI